MPAVLSDKRHRRSSLEEHGVGSAARQIGTAAHGDRNLRLRQHRRVIDAVAGHCDDGASPPAARAYRRVLVLGQSYCHVHRQRCPMHDAKRRTTTPASSPLKIETAMPCAYSAATISFGSRRSICHRCRNAATPTVRIGHAKPPLSPAPSLPCCRLRRQSGCPCSSCAIGCLPQPNSRELTRRQASTPAPVRASHAGSGGGSSRAIGRRR